MTSESNPAELAATLIGAIGVMVALDILPKIFEILAAPIRAMFEGTVEVFIALGYPSLLAPWFVALGFGLIYWHVLSSPGMDDGVWDVVVVSAPADHDRDRGETRTVEEQLADLQEQYAAGEIAHVAFEQRVEEVLAEAEDRDEVGPSDLDRELAALADSSESEPDVSEA